VKVLAVYKVLRNFSNILMLPSHNFVMRLLHLSGRRDKLVTKHFLIFFMIKWPRNVYMEMIYKVLFLLLTYVIISACSYCVGAF
jgi:hypothetical protein